VIALRAIALASVLVLGPGAIAQKSIDGGEVARTFDQGRVAYREAGSVTDATIAAARPSLAALKPDAFKATIVYLHGCDGINALSLKTADLLAAAGYLVFMPDSFARLDKPRSCEPLEFRGGLHREVLAWRHAEADWALKQARSLPAVDARRLFLFGLSEGAIAAATYDGEGLRGRVIEAWTCHAGWPEYRGLAARPGEAVLALTSENDPWFQDPALRGDCGEFTGSSTLRRTIVFRPPHPAASHHDLMWNSDARRAVLDFLEQALRDGR
jgi:dienelactone hydrolase